MPGISPTLAVLVLHVVLSALVFSAFSVEVFEFPKMLLLRATCVALAVAALWEWLRGGATGVPREAAWRDPLVLSVCAFLASAALSALAGVSPPRSLLGAEHRFHGLATFAGYALLFFAARAAVLGARAEPALLWAAATAAAGVVAYGAVQVAGADPMAWGDLHSFRDQVRPGSTLGNPTFSGAYLGMALPVVLVLARRAFGAGRAAVGVGLVVLAAACLALIAATLTRGSWIAVAVTLPALALLLRAAGDRRGARAVAIGCGAAVLTAGLLLATPAGSRLASLGWERFAVLGEPARAPRAEFWRASVAAFRERPWLGAGPDTFQLVYPAHQSPASWRLPIDGAPSHPHHEGLQVAVGQGLLGLATLGAALALLVRAAGLALRRGATPRARVLAAGACGAWVAYTVACQVGFATLATGSLAAVTAGLLAGAAGRGKVRPARAPAPGALALVLAGAGVAGAALLLANGLAQVRSAESAVWIAPAAVLFATVAVSAAAWVTERGGEHAASSPFRPRAGSGATFLTGGVAALLAATAIAVLVIAPWRADLFARRASALLDAGRHAEAISQLEEAARRTPTRELLQIELGVAHHRAALAELPLEARLAHLHAARLAHERALVLEPRNPLSHANRARVLGDLSRLRPEEVGYGEVAAGFADALELAPRHPRVLADASRAALLAGRTADAEALARRSLESYPRHAAAWALVAAAHMQRGELAEAEVALHAALEADWRGETRHEAAAWRSLARLLDGQARAEEARAADARALELLGPGTP